MSSHSHGKGPAVVAALLCGIGCNKPDTAILATPEEIAQLSLAAEQVDATRELHINFAEKADQNLVFAVDGTTGAASYAEDYQNSVDVLMEINAGGRYYTYHGNEETDRPDLKTSMACYFVGEDGASIGINLDTTSIEQVDGYILSHETMHAFTGDHSQGLQDARTGNESDAEVVDLAQTFHDVPYQASLFQSIIDQVYHQLQYKKDYTYYAESGMQNGRDPQVIYDQFSLTPAMKDRQEWARLMAEDAYRGTKDIGEGYAISESEYAVVLAEDPNLYNEQHEEALEWLSEFKTKYIDSREADEAAYARRGRR